MYLFQMFNFRVQPLSAAPPAATKCGEGACSGKKKKKSSTPQHSSIRNAESKVIIMN